LCVSVDVGGSLCFSYKLGQLLVFLLGGILFGWLSLAPGGFWVP